VFLLRAAIEWVKENLNGRACHGSRFDRFGYVMNGPASRDLA
jgi:Rieske Fe-S protein